MDIIKGRISLKKLKICQATCGKPYMININNILFPSTKQLQKNKANKDQDFSFCGGTEKSRFKIFQELFVQERIYCSFFYNFLILLAVNQGK